MSKTFRKYFSYYVRVRKGFKRAEIGRSEECPVRWKALIPDSWETAYIRNETTHLLCPYTSRLMNKYKKQNKPDEFFIKKIQKKLNLSHKVAETAFNEYAKKM